jgi:hypothetical protein
MDTQSTRHTGIRRYRRFRVENMNVNAKTLFAAETELLNISAGGACIKARQSLKTTDKQLVKLESEAARLTLPCSVVWENFSCDTAEPAEKSVPSYEVGVSFMNMPPDKLVMLKDFIRKSGTPYEQRLSDAYKPSLLRFTVHTNKQALVFYTKTLPVKKIGLGGMLVELAGDIQPGEVFPMELFIPDETAPTRFRGRIASRIPLPDREAGRFDIGVEFLDMTSADKFRLSKFLLFSRISPET